MPLSFSFLPSSGLLLMLAVLVIAQAARAWRHRHHSSEE